MSITRSASIRSTSRRSTRTSPSAARTSTCAAGPGACFLYLHPRHLDGRLRTLDTGWFAKRDPFAYLRPDPPAVRRGRRRVPRIDAAGAAVLPGARRPGADAGARASRACARIRSRCSGGWSALLARTRRAGDSAAPRIAARSSVVDEPAPRHGPTRCGARRRHRRARALPAAVPGRPDDGRGTGRRRERSQARPMRAGPTRVDTWLRPPRGADDRTARAAISDTTKIAASATPTTMTWCGRMVTASLRIAWPLRMPRKLENTAPTTSGSEASRGAGGASGGVRRRIGSGEIAWDAADGVSLAC